MNVITDLGITEGETTLNHQTQTNQIPQTNVTTAERARPVLGTQPTPPGTTTFRYIEDQGPSLEMVPVTPYYVEEPSPSPSYMDQPNDYGYDGSDHMVSVNAHTLMLMANGAFRQPGGYNNNTKSEQIRTKTECQN